jgi:hypothetical protein
LARGKALDEVGVQEVMEELEVFLEGFETFSLDVF